MAELQVEIVATDRLIWKGTASYVSVPAARGELGILPGRQSLLSLLDRGTVRVNSADGHVLSAQIEGGFVTVDGDIVTVTADSGSDVTSSEERDTQVGA